MVKIINGKPMGKTNYKWCIFFLPCLMTGPRVGWHPGRNADAPGPAAKDDAAEGVEGAVSIPRDIPIEIPIDMGMSENGVYPQ